MLFILGDADRIRERVERYLLSSELALLSSFSERLAASITDLVRGAQESLGAEALMAGGDDILFRVSSTAYSRPALEALLARFRGTSGCTISFGVGADVQTAYLNLRRAKASGGDIIVDDEGKVP